MEEKYYKKYLKYRSKYLATKNQIGGGEVHYFHDNEKIRNLENNKTGKIVRFRDNRDGVEHYSVVYDDGSFNTFESQENLLRLVDRPFEKEVPNTLPNLNADYIPMANVFKQNEPPQGPSGPSGPSGPQNKVQTYYYPSYVPPAPVYYDDDFSRKSSRKSSKKSSKKSSRKSSKKSSKKSRK